MIFSDLCNATSIDFDESRKRFQNRRLRTLHYLRDSLERRLSAIDASIKTLENQIKRDTQLES